ncbi:MAG: hypothetical protein RR795_01580 [Cetobacterium sp.]|uniref:hypothetical protein n=1 Tax=Cetobacterium sp. TaxID=2071632 RepID=UPI002FCA4CAF
MINSCFYCKHQECRGNYLDQQRICDFHGFFISYSEEDTKKFICDNFEVSSIYESEIKKQRCNFREIEEENNGN